MNYRFYFWCKGSIMSFKIVDLICNCTFYMHYSSGKYFFKANQRKISGPVVFQLSINNFSHQRDYWLKLILLTYHKWYLTCLRVIFNGRKVNCNQWLSIHIVSSGRMYFLNIYYVSSIDCSQNGIGNALSTAIEYLRYTLASCKLSQ